MGDVTTLSASISAAVDRLPHGNEAHLRYLHMKLYTADQARARARWIGGRLYNRAAGENPDYVPMSTRHLAQTLKLLDVALPGGVKTDERYLLRTDLAREAHDALRSHLGGGSG
jgi:hypothetical protein